MYLAVTCKNTEYHRQHDSPSGYRIRLPRKLPGKFKVLCDRCGKQYSYDPDDVLEVGDD
jgi:hypothetical protein